MFSNVTVRGDEQQPHVVLAAQRRLVLHELPHPLRLVRLSIPVLSAFRFTNMALTSRGGIAAGSSWRQILVLTEASRLPKNPYGFFLRCMKKLAEKIRRELEIQTQTIGHCAIYEPDLQRLWPIEDIDRKQKIAQFANQYGFKLSFYKKRLCAIFERAIGERQQESTPT